MLNSTFSLILPSLIVIALVLLFYLVTQIIKKQSSRNPRQSSLVSLKTLRSKRQISIRFKHLLGYILLLVALIIQANIASVDKLVSNFFVLTIDKPAPHSVKSPWPWPDYKIHPIVSNMPSSIEISVKSVAQYIAQQESDPYLRVKALHDYVASRITYDLNVLKTGIRPPQDAQTVFITRKAVCEGYANLFMALGQAIGEDIVLIKGDIRRDLAPTSLIPTILRVIRSKYNWTRHAWNAVKILGNWYLVDVTWDSGLDYRADYLMIPPEVMSVSHFPDQLSWQLLPVPENHNTFERKAILTPQFFADGLTLMSPSEYQTKVKNNASITIESPWNYHKRILAVFAQEKDKSLLGDLLQNFPLNLENEPYIKACQSQQDIGGQTQISCQFPRSGDYRVFLYSLDPNRAGRQYIGQLKFNVF